MAELWINDDNYLEQIDFALQTGRRLEAMPRRTEYGQFYSKKDSAKLLAQPFHPDQLIPRDRWDDLIAQKDAEKSWLDDILAGKIPCKDQNGLSYCHAYCLVGAMEDARHVINLEYVDISAESIGGPITGWTNSGAYPEDDLDQAVEFGACPASFMDKPHSRAHNRWKEGWEAARADFRVLSYWDLGMRGKIFDALVTCAFLNIPSMVGYGWWRHAVKAGYRVRKQGKAYGVKHRNSWGADYGEDGYFWLEEGRGTPDLGSFGIRYVTPSGR